MFEPGIDGSLTPRFERDAGHELQQPVVSREAARPDPMIRWMLALTDSQRQAVEAPEPMVCVLATAGSGKTRVLTLRVAHRVQAGATEEGQVLVCTFSRKAAEELRRRLWTLGLGRELRASTLHSTALHLLRLHRRDHGARPPAVLSDRRRALAAMLGDTPADIGAGASGLEQLDTEIGWAKARLVAPEDYERAARLAKRRPGLGTAHVADLYNRYETKIRRKGLLDLDDLISAATATLERDARFAVAARWRFRHVFVDEMQDVNPAQFRLLSTLLSESSDLFVVGDPNQSIYGWNGADPDLMTQVASCYPGTRVIRLEENHRSTRQITATASAVLELESPSPASPWEPAGHGADGPLPEVHEHDLDTDEAAFVARRVYLAHRPGRRWSHIAVLARTNGQLVAFSEALFAAHIPFSFAGSGFTPASDVHAGDESATADDARTGHDAGIGQIPTHEPGSGAHHPDEVDGVVLSTFHRAKGLQWPVTFVVGLSEGLVPIAAARSAPALKEEQRLLYVALTRAEEELICSWARHPDERARTSGQPPRRPSRWLASIARARNALAADDAPAPPEAVARHLARIRTLLARDPHTAAAPAKAFDDPRRSPRPVATSRHRR